MSVGGDGMGCGQGVCSLHFEGMGCSLFMSLGGEGVRLEIVHATLLEGMGCGEGPQLVVRSSKVIVLC